MILQIEAHGVGSRYRMGNCVWLGFHLSKDGVDSPLKPRLDGGKDGWHHLEGFFGSVMQTRICDDIPIHQIPHVYTYKDVRDRIRVSRSPSSVFQQRRENSRFSISNDEVLSVREEDQGRCKYPRSYPYQTRAI